jgi:hypothetical protein
VWKQGLALKIKIYRLFVLIYVIIVKKLDIVGRFKKAVK